MRFESGVGEERDAGSLQLVAHGGEVVDVLPGARSRVPCPAPAEARDQHPGVGVERQAVVLARRGWWEGPWRRRSFESASNPTFCLR